MKIKLLCLQLVFFCLSAVHYANANASEESWEYKDWSVSVNEDIVSVVLVVLLLTRWFRRLL